MYHSLIYRFDFTFITGLWRDISPYFKQTTQPSKHFFHWILLSHLRQSVSGHSLLSMAHLFCTKTPAVWPRALKNMPRQEAGTTHSINIVSLGLIFNVLFHMKITEARSSKNAFLHFSMFCFSWASHSSATPKQVNQDAYMLHLSHSDVPAGPLGSLATERRLRQVPGAGNLLLELQET